jgi:tripartite ATP-independent transporter DctM subunit
VIALAALPTMLERRHDPAVATSSIAAAGTLGVILPPAVMLFFLADLVGTTILATFAGILGPAALLLLLYIVYFAINGRAKAGQVVTTGNDELPKGAGWRLIGVVAVVGSVLGAIATGFATPSQSGSCGALAAFVLLLLTGELTRSRFKDILVETAYITAMVFLIIIAANAFSLVFRVLDGDALVSRFLGSLGLGDWGTLLFILAVIFLLGFFIDWLEIVIISLPIFIPIIEKLDFTAHVGSPLLVKVWIGAAMAIVLQTSFLTPPFGFALFFLRGASPPEVRMADIYRGAIPIVLIQLIVLAVLLVMPGLATGLAGLTLD